MEEPFEIPVMLNGEEVLYPAQLVQRGYTHRFAVTVQGQEVLFEPDEEGTYRALIEPETESAAKPVPANVLQAISEAIKAILQ